MKLIGNIFNDIREISGFTKEELLEVKRDLSKFQSENTKQEEIEEYLKKRFTPEIIEHYSNYQKQVNLFWDSYLKVQPESDSINNTNYYDLRTKLLDEIKLFSNNLVNLKLNTRNSKRFLKTSPFLDDFLTSIQSITELYETLKLQLENSIKKIEKSYDNTKYLWIESNKIKNLNFELKKMPTTLTVWEEIKDLITFIEDLDKNSEKKKKKKKGDLPTFSFNDIHQYFLKKQDNKLDFYLDLLYLLNVNQLIEVKEFTKEEFVNIIQRKEISENVKKFLRPIIRALIEDILREILDEIIEFDKSYTLEDKQKLNLKSLLQLKVNEYLPQIVNYYFMGLEKKIEKVINEVVDLIEFKNIKELYSEKIDTLLNLFNNLSKKVLENEPYLKPYSDLSSLSKTFESLKEEISRRKDEFLYYIKTVKKERLRDNIRNFISEKISEVNNLVTTYQDKTSSIVREEFPQLKQIRDILTVYKSEIQQIKDEVYKKLEGFKEKEIEIYQLIKQWEDNFTRKSQQISFLLSLLLNKLYKNFKDLVQEEDLIFEEITEIKGHEEKADTLPLNFALSDFLADKLTAEELDERIGEVNAKINKLTQELDLYKQELIKLEDYQANKVRIREGITETEVKCTVCHKKINLGKDKIIKCPFCSVVYHYMCVVYWLGKYNSCPMCQNQFLDPNSGLFDIEE